jgi:hypothetical protein
MAVSTVPSIINYLVNRDDPEYWEIAEWQRDLFWPFKVGGKWWRIPKGDTGVLFGTTAEKILEHLDKDRNSRLEIDKLAASVIQECLPISDLGGIMPVALRMPVENMTNMNLFLNRPIVSRGKEKLDPKYQYGPYTSETAKAIGEKTGLSPQKIEHAVLGYTAGLGRHALKISDWMLGDMGIIPTKEPRPKEPADYPLIGAFAIRHPEGFGSESANRFYEVIKKMEGYRTTSKFLERKGKNTEYYAHERKHPVERRIYAPTGKKGARLSTEFFRARTRLSELRKKEEKILEGKLSIGAKKTQIDQIDKEVMKLVTGLLAKYRIMVEMYE